jgi:hypothetical protein
MLTNGRDTVTPTWNASSNQTAPCWSPKSEPGDGEFLFLLDLL